MSADTWTQADRGAAVADARIQERVSAALNGFDGAGDPWPAPTPLPDALPAVQQFNADLLPAALRPWVTDIAERMQCPADFSAVGCIVGLSSLIGARVVVQPKARDDWQVVPNLWGATIGRPGVMKTPAITEVLKPLHRLQGEENERSQADHEAWVIDSKLAEMQAADREKRAKKMVGTDPAKARELLAPLAMGAEPVSRRYIVNDFSVEKLGELLAVNPWGTLAYRDELHGLIASLDKPGQEGARAFLLQSYDGNQGYTFDRIGRGTVHIPRVCLSLLGGIQPGRLDAYVRDAVTGGAGDDGLLQRFGLAVWPDVGGEFVNVDRWPDTPAKAQAYAVFERFAHIQPANENESIVWRFDAIAQEIFSEWRIPFERELRRGEMHPALESHLAKYRKLIPALALILALVDAPNAGGIGERDLLRALAWSKYLRSHAERLYSAAARPETGASAILLRKIRSGALPNPFTPREVAHKGWTGLASPADVRKAACMLCDYDWLRLDVLPSGAAGGRPSERYIVNPAAEKGAA